MFVQAKQAPVDAQSGACGVQELTNLYLVLQRYFAKIALSDPTEGTVQLSKL